jgi:hypothetical protein
MLDRDNRKAHHLPVACALSVDAGSFTPDKNWLWLLQTIVSENFITR